MKTWVVLLAAAEHQAPPLIDFDWTSIVQLGIFLVLLLFLSRLVFRPYLALLRERSAAIEGAKEQAAEMNSTTAASLARYEEQVMQARRDAAQVRIELRQKGETTGADVVAEARAQAESRLAGAREKIAKSTAATQLALRTRADRIAQEIASKLLGREV